MYQVTRLLVRVVILALFKYSDHYFYWIAWKVLYVPETSSLGGMCFAGIFFRYFLQVCDLSLHFYNTVFWRAEFKDFVLLWYINFFFYGLCFCVISKNSLPNLGWQTTADSTHCFFFVNKVLLEHGHAHLFTYCLWLLSCYRDRVEYLQ